MNLIDQHELMMTRRQLLAKGRGCLGAAALASLLLGGFALMDPYLAVRIPDPITPSLLFRAGVGGVAVAILLAVIL